MKKIFLSIALLSSMMFTACEDMLDVEQKATSNTANFYKTDADAESALTAMYATYINEIGGTEGIWNAYIMGLNYSADDVFAAGGDINDHADFRILNEFRYDASSLPIGNLYNHIYKAIYSANLIIHYLVKQQILLLRNELLPKLRLCVHGHTCWLHRCIINLL